MVVGLKVGINGGGVDCRGLVNEGLGLERMGFGAFV